MAWSIPGRVLQPLHNVPGFALQQRARSAFQQGVGFPWWQTVSFCFAAKFGLCFAKKYVSIAFIFSFLGLKLRRHEHSMNNDMHPWFLSCTCEHSYQERTGTGICVSHELLIKTTKFEWGHAVICMHVSYFELRDITRNYGSTLRILNSCERSHKIVSTAMHLCFLFGRKKYLHIYEHHNKICIYVWYFEFCEHSYKAGSGTGI